MHPNDCSAILIVQKVMADGKPTKYAPVPLTSYDVLFHFILSKSSLEIGDIHQEMVVCIVAHIKQMGDHLTTPNSMHLLL